MSRKNTRKKLLANAKKEDFGRFSRTLLKKKYGDNYKVITEKDYSDLNKTQKKIFDSTKSEYKKDKSNKLIVIGEVNKQSLGVKPRHKFSNVSEIDSRSSKIRTTQEQNIAGGLLYKRKKDLDEKRSQVLADTDFDDIEKGKTSAMYSGATRGGINPSTYTPSPQARPKRTKKKLTDGVKKRMIKKLRDKKSKK